MEENVRKERDAAEDIFVDDLPEYLKCPICLCCLRNPYQTPCGHRFCKECILPILHSRNNVCPIDRSSIDPNNTFPDNAVKLQINSLKIRCPMEGCQWMGELSDKTVHLSKCQFVALVCDLCGQSVLKTKMTEHAKECPQRKVKCKYCTVEVAFSSVDSHFASCLDFPVSCTFKCESSETFTRRNIRDHLDVCPRAPVTCSMAGYGCNEKVERSQLKEHLQVCVPQHAHNLCLRIEDLQREVKELRITLAAQQERMHDMETTLYPSAGQFTWRIDDIRGKIVSAQGDQTAGVIYSPPFYSVEAGYKLSLCIYPAGDNNQGFLSLYFVVMKGSFDEILPWPFQKRVYLSLLNTKGGQSMTKDIQPDPRLHYFHRPENPRNVGFGYPKFISLTRLVTEDSEFVENGAIFLRCRVFD